MAHNIGHKVGVKVVAMDFDGVMTDLKVDWDAARKLASEISGRRVVSMLGFYEEYYGTPVFWLVHSEVEKLEFEALTNAHPAPSFIEYIGKISEACSEIYIATMQSKTVVEEFLDRHDIKQYFKGILTRNDFPNKREQIKYLIHHTKVNPSEILIIDDLVRNLTVCRELGIKCYHFNRSKPDKELWELILRIIYD